MFDSTSDIPTRASRAEESIAGFMDSGHLIRALVELRALLDETRFLHDPDAAPDVRATYLKSVDRFAEWGVNESELRITLHA